MPFFLEIMILNDICIISHFTQSCYTQMTNIQHFPVLIESLHKYIDLLIKYDLIVIIYIYGVILCDSNLQSPQ